MGYKLSANAVGFSDSPVNTKTTGATAIFTTVDSNRLFFPYKIRVYCNNGTGFVTGSTISVGTNASSYNNILPATVLSTLTTSNTYIDLLPTFPVVPIAAGAQVFVNVTNAANATTLSVRLAIYGDTI